MKFISKKINTFWDYDKNLEGLLVFVQRLQELSYSASEYIEKNGRVSIWKRLTEYLDSVKLFIKVNDQKFNKEFTILYDEITFQLRTDNVSNIILGEKRNRYLTGIHPNNNPVEIMQNLEIMLLKLDHTKWFDLYKKKILLVLEDIHKKDEIINYTDLLFEFLVYYGYQKSTIYHLINVYFYDEDQKSRIKECQQIFGFLDFFDLEYKEFEVYFRCAKFFKEIESSCSNFQIEICSAVDLKPEESYNKVIEEKFFKKSDKKDSIFVKTKIRAVDYAHAAKMGAQRVSLISNLFTVFHHRAKPWISDACLVFHHKKKNVVFINTSNNPMATLKDSEFNTAKDIFPVFLARFGLVQDSFERFSRGVELHALSLTTNEPASQILNLWICLETLLIREKNATHISIVEDLVKKIKVPTMLQDRLLNLLTLLSEWDKPKVFKSLEKIILSPEMSSNELKLAALLSLKEYEEIATELLAQMDEVPLLRYKVSKMIRTCQKMSKIKSEISDMEKKIEWDIRRIYRTRNKIVHQGNIQQDSSELIVESAHYYLDQIIGSIILKKIRYEDINSIDNYLHEVKLIEEEYKSILISIQNLDKTNFVKVLLGLDYVV